jgi:GT2 family glycosyltransferase
MYNEQWPRVSFVVVHYSLTPERFESLIRCIESLQGLDYPNFEIILVDNASADGGADHIEAYYRNVRILRNEENLGWPGAVNRGAAIATGKYLFFPGDDMEFPVRFLRTIVTYAEQHPRAAVVVSSALIEKYGAHVDELLPLYSHGSRIDLLCNPIHNNTPAPCFFAGGSLGFIRREVFEHVGGFDPDYFLYHEDHDLGWRIRLAGYTIEMCPEACAFLGTGGPPAARTDRKVFWVERNSLLTILKNYAVVNLVWILPLYILQSLGTMAFAAIFLRDWRQAWAVVKAYGWVIAHWSQILAKRSAVQRTRVTSDREIMKAMYVGWCGWRRGGELRRLTNKGNQHPDASGWMSRQQLLACSEDYGETICG